MIEFMEKLQPRLFKKSREEIIINNLDLFNLPNTLESKIKSILNGESSESSLVCCNSGCDVCNETIVHCIEKVKQDLIAN
jgi:hypothetical protein